MSGIKRTIEKKVDATRTAITATITTAQAEEMLKGMLPFKIPLELKVMIAKSEGKEWFCLMFRQIKKSELTHIATSSSLSEEKQQAKQS